MSYCGGKTKIKIYMLIQKSIAQHLFTVFNYSHNKDQFQKNVIPTQREDKDL